MAYAYEMTKNNDSLSDNINIEPNIIGIKEASSDLDQINYIIKNT